MTPSAPVSEPSHAERARTLLARATSAALSTLAREPAGHPYVSLVAMAVDGEGRPLFFLSSLAEHTQNLLARPEASLLVADAGSVDPLASGRVTVLGRCARIPASESGAAREAFVAARPSAAAYAGFADFAMWRLEPEALRWVGGFGRMSWVDAEDYRRAAPDPLAESAERVLSHMNQDHADAMLDYARVLANIADATAATMTALDRFGFDLSVTTADGLRTARLAFDAPVHTSDEVRRAMIALVARCRDAKR